MSLEGATAAHDLASTTFFVQLPPSLLEESVLLGLVLPASCFLGIIGGHELVIDSLLYLGFCWTKLWILHNHYLMQISRDSRLHQTDL